MKKVLAIFLAFIIGLSMSAQIQNKLLGFTLGTTTKVEVYNYYKSNHREITQNNAGDYSIHRVEFGGQVWDTVFFRFYNGKLVCVGFVIDDFTASDSLLDGIWEYYKKILKDKYAKYIINSTPTDIWFNDSKTTLILTNDYVPGFKGVGLMYSDNALTLQIQKAEQDEL